MDSFFQNSFLTKWSITFCQTSSDRMYLCDSCEEWIKMGNRLTKSINTKMPKKVKRRLPILRYISC